MLVAGALALLIFVVAAIGSLLALDLGEPTMPTGSVRSRPVSS